MTDESLNLLPCPWCNGEARIVESVDTGEKYGGPHFIIRCPSIVGDFVTGCLGNHTNLWDMTPEDATNRWNRRTPQPDKAGVEIEAEAKRLFAATSAGWSNVPAWEELHWQTRELYVARALENLATPPPPGAGEDRRDGERWQFYAASPQTALMLGSDKDPNDASINWTAECNRLADAAMRGEGNG